MANPEHVSYLRQGVEQWNNWRRAHSDIEPDLRDAYLGKTDLSGANLSRANLSHANLSGSEAGSKDWSSAWLGGAKLLYADLSGANLRNADLRGVSMYRANLSDADLSAADLSGHADRDGLFGVVLSNASLIRANLSGADMRVADLSNADLTCANLTGADLSGADLSFAQLEEANLSGANISYCRIYGVSAWSIKLDNAVQKGLAISKAGYTTTVDDLEVAQFVHLIMNNKKLRNVLDTVTSKVVLILGRFQDKQRKAVLEGLREKLREFGLLPVVFDFDGPTDKDYAETVQTLTGMSMFVIADVTSPKSTPLELEATVKNYKIPYVPILDVSADPRPFAMLVDLQKSFHWVLPLLKYETSEDLLDDENLKSYIIEPALAKRDELRRAKQQEPEAITIRKRR